MKALPARFYRDPIDCVDEMRRVNEAAKRQAEKDRLNKGRRIRALVKRAVVNGGGR